MPTKIVAYECQFCHGKMYRKSSKSVEDHEPRCMSNPARKTCKTCWHDEEKRTPLPKTGWFKADGFICKEGHKPEGTRIVWDCQHWYESDEGHCDLQEMISAQKAVEKLLAVKGTVQ